MPAAGGAEAEIRRGRVACSNERLDAPCRIQGGALDVGQDLDLIGGQPRERQASCCLGPDFHFRFAIVAKSKDPLINLKEVRANRQFTTALMIQFLLYSAAGRRFTGCYMNIPGRRRRR